MSGLENKTLACNLIFRGIDEALIETDDALKGKICLCIADTYNYHDQHDQIAAARACPIRKCKRLGRPNPSRLRPISVEFENRKDVDSILEYKYYLAKGIYVDREYSIETERK